MPRKNHKSGPKKEASKSGWKNSKKDQAEPRRKELIPISADTLNKFKRFLCSEVTGGELDEEQALATAKEVVAETAPEQKSSTIETTKQPSAEKKASQTTTPSDQPPAENENKEEGEYQYDSEVETAIRRKEGASKLLSYIANKEKEAEPPQANQAGLTRKQKIMNRQAPDFLKPENRKDIKGRTPSDPDFDPSSLLLTKSDYADMSDGMKRYWDIKSKNMDKVLFWRFGDWYVIYFDDLTNCAKVGLDLVITPFPQRWPPRVGFEATSLERNIGLMTEQQYASKVRHTAMR